ncbi:MAG: hypothetical protein M3Q91_10920 [Acidobacteriota bacterium]|nr:hypothetical protein [Acidobacteriota bacterium]
MELEMFALRHQLAVLQRRARNRPALTSVAAMAFSIAHRSAGNSNRLASQRLSAVLDLEAQGTAWSP